MCNKDAKNKLSKKSRNKGLLHASVGKNCPWLRLVKIVLGVTTVKIK
jgi:hypothetical protein